MTFPTDLVRFKRSEFKFPDQMNIPFLRWLDRVAQRAGKHIPFIVTGDGRVPGVVPPGGAATSMHYKGQAVDIRSRIWSDTQKWLVLKAIVELADEAPWKICWEPVYSATDQHWHLDVKQDRAVHLLHEADE